MAQQDNDQVPTSAPAEKQAAVTGNVINPATLVSRAPQADAVLSVATSPSVVDSLQQSTTSLVASSQSAATPASEASIVTAQSRAKTTVTRETPLSLDINTNVPTSIVQQAVLPTGSTLTMVNGMTVISLPDATTTAQLIELKKSLALVNQPVMITQKDASVNLPTLSNNMEIGTANGNVTGTNASTQFTGNGTSVQFNNNGTVGLTEDKNDEVGHANLNNTVDFTKSFTLKGSVQIGNKTGPQGGADGVSLVFVPSPENPTQTYNGQPGGGLGVAGLKDAMAFVFDTYYWNGGDPNQVYIGWRTTDQSGQLNSYSYTAQSNTTWRPMNNALIDGNYHNFTMTYTIQSNGDGLLTMTVPDNGGNGITFTKVIPKAKQTNYTLSFAASTGGSKNAQGAGINSLTYTKGVSKVTLNVKTPSGQSAPITVTANIGDTIHVYPDKKSAQAAIDTGMDPSTVVVWDNSLGYGLKSAVAYTVTNDAAQTTPEIDTGNVVTTTIHYIDATGKQIKDDRTISGVDGTAIDLSAVEPASEVKGTDGLNYLLTKSPNLKETFGTNTSLTYTFTADPTPTVTAAESQVNSYQAMTSGALSSAKSALVAASYAASVSPNDKNVINQYSATQSYYTAILGQGSAATSAQSVLDSVNGKVAQVITTANSANSLATNLEQTYLKELADASAANVAAQSANSLYQWEKNNFKNDSNLVYYSNMAQSDQNKAASANTAASSATQQYNSALAVASTAIANASSVANSAAAAAQTLTNATSITAAQTTSTASQAKSTAATATSIAASNVASTAQSVVHSVQSAALSAAMTAIQANVTASQALSLASADQANGTVQTGAGTTSQNADTGNKAARSANNDANKALQFASLAASAADDNDVSAAYDYAMSASSLAAQANSEAQVTHSAAAIVTSATKTVASQVTVDSQVSSQLASQAQSIASTAVNNAVTASGAAD